MLFSFVLFFAMLCESVVDTTISIKVIETQHTLRSLNKRRMIQFDSSFQQWAMLPLIAGPLKELEAGTWLELINRNILANFILHSVVLFLNALRSFVD